MHSVVTVECHAPSLDRAVTYTALIPENGTPPFAVLYQLHGASDDHRAWLYKSNILRYVDGFVNVSEARSDWAPDPAHPLPKFNPARRVPHGVTLIGRLFDEGTIARAGLALERSLNVMKERPAGF